LNSPTCGSATASFQVLSVAASCCFTRRAVLGDVYRTGVKGAGGGDSSSSRRIDRCSELDRLPRRVPAVPGCTPPPPML